MAIMSWQDAVEKLTPYVVKISTPTGSGSGFLFTYAGDKSVCGIATAAHVIAHAHDWESPIRVQHHSSGQTVLLQASQRAIVIDKARDTAAIVFSKGAIPLPEDALPLSPEGKHLKIGIEIGWLGFPGIAANNLCFFSGRISSRAKNPELYLVDGVALTASVVAQHSSQTPPAHSF